MKLAKPLNALGRREEWRDMSRSDSVSTTLVIAVAALLYGGGCGKAGFANPSGACGTRSDGGRAGYQAPDAQDQWVPDCQNPLRREYWRVFSQDGASAYVIPRPDGAPELATPCANADHDLHPVVVRYQLCSAAESTEQVGIINHVDLTDALHVTHFLHSQLEFAATQDGRGIQPFAIPSDVLDACSLGGQPNSLELESICQSVRDAISSGIEMRGDYSGPGGAELVTRLNALYGIP
jgi:hypothetical protein